jgi:ankyrin repeat protein
LLLLGKWPWEKAGEILALLVDKGANLSLPDRNGQTPLHYFAALGGQSPLFFIRDSGNIFLRTKADFQARDSDGNTPLHVAIKSGTWDVYDWLREHGASLDVTNNAGLTPRRLVMDSGDPFAWSKMNADTDIYWAIREDKLEAVIAIVKAEPGVVNKFNLFGETPMKEAVQLRRTNIVEFLDQHGGEWDCFSAITMGRTDVLSHLISQQPWTVTDRYDGETLLHLVAANGNVAAVDVLVKAGADLQAINSFGLSPLGEALECRHDEVAELLVKHGAAKNIFDAAVAGDGEAVAGLIAKDRSLLSSVNAQGVSVAEIAAAADNVKTLRLLLDQGVSPDFRDQRLGKSLLHIAAAYNRPENVKLLIARGANVDVFDNLGFTPLHVAALWNSTEVLELLLQHKAQCNVLATAPKAILPAAPFRPGSAVADVEGSTPLHLAALNAQTNAIVLLLKWGAAINATDSSGMTALDLAGQAGPPQFELMHSTGVGMPFPPPDPMRDNLDVRRKTAVALLEQVGGKHGEN